MLHCSYNLVANLVGFACMNTFTWIIYRCFINIQWTVEPQIKDDLIRFCRAEPQHVMVLKSLQLYLKYLFLLSYTSRETRATSCGFQNDNDGFNKLFSTGSTGTYLGRLGTANESPPSSSSVLGPSLPRFQLIQLFTATTKKVLSQSWQYWTKDVEIESLLDCLPHRRSSRLER